MKSKRQELLERLNGLHEERIFLEKEISNDENNEKLKKELDKKNVIFNETIVMISNLDYHMRMSNFN